MRELILSEANYRETMDTVVKPYLEKRKTQLWPEREPGQKIHCVCYTADRAKGVVLISHGFTETAEKYPECCYYFLKNGYHVYCMEHCGHGHSYRLTDDPYLVHTDCFERYADDLLFTAAQAKESHPKLPLFLYAHSMGGGIGAAAAARQPELFKKIVLTSPMIRPSTGQVPWTLARFIAGACCAAGKDKCYIMGQTGYSGPETFEESASASRERFDYYQEKRSANRLYQMNAASYGWLKSAAKLNRYLITEGWKKITAPVLLFQAEREDFVSKREQERFVRKLNRRGNAALIKVPQTKHEIFFSHSNVLKRYWEKIFAFLED